MSAGSDDDLSVNPIDPECNAFPKPQKKYKKKWSLIEKTKSFKKVCVQK